MRLRLLRRAIISGSKPLELFLGLDEPRTIGCNWCPVLDTTALCKKSESEDGAAVLGATAPIGVR